MPNSITVGDNTSLAQLQTFLANQSKGSTLLAKTNDQGETVLYTRSSANIVKQRIFGSDRLQEKQDLARDLMTDVFKRFHGEQTFNNESATGAATRLFDHIADNLDERTEQGFVRVKDVRQMIDGVDTVLRALPTRPDPVPPQQAPKGPSLAATGLKTDDAALDDAVTDLASGEDPKKVAGELGTWLALGIMTQNPVFSDREPFAFSTGERLIGDLVSALKGNLNGAQISDDMLTQVATEAFGKATALLLPDRVIDAPLTKVPSANGRFVDLPSITVGGHDYKPTGYLGEGGYGKVYEFTSLTDPTKKIAVKLSNDTSPKAMDEALEEIDLHRGAFGDGCDQVVGFEGALRMPDGRIAIAMELAPHGTVHDFSQVLSDAIATGPQQGPGQITEAEASIVRLTMLLDMATGLEHMHDEQGVTHYDLKGPNCFIGEDGTVKLADFGLSIEGDGPTRSEDAGKIDNPFWKAPELCRQDGLRGRLKDLEKTTFNHDLTQKVSELRQLLPSASEGTLKTLARSILLPRSEELAAATASDRQMLFFERSVDVWGLGATALQLFTGVLPADFSDGGFLSESQEMIEKHGANRNNVALADPGPDGKPQGGALGLKTGDPQIDGLLNAMLAPDPRDRPDARQILGHSAMGRDGVGSDEARALIVALKSGDPQKILQARQALGAVM